MPLTRKERETWLNGRKVHGITDDGRGIACRPSYSLASGWAFNDRPLGEKHDLRRVTCLACRNILKKQG